MEIIVMGLWYILGTLSITNIKHHVLSPFKNNKKLSYSEGILLRHYIRLALLILENRNIYTLDPLTNLFSYIRYWRAKLSNVMLLPLTPPTAISKNEQMASHERALELPCTHGRFWLAVWPEPNFWLIFATDSH